MKIDNLKKKLTKESLIVLGAIAALAVICAGVFYQKSSMEKELEQITNDTNALNGKTRSAQLEYESYIASFETFNKIPEHKGLNEALFTVPERIRAARPVIDNLKDKYKLGSVDGSFAPISKVESKHKVKAVDIISGEITVNFSALSDELILSFIHSLISDLPGYLNIKKIDIERKNELNSAYLDALNGQKIIPPNVSGTIVLDWQTIQSKPSEKPGEKNG